MGSILPSKSTNVRTKKSQRTQRHPAVVATKAGLRWLSPHAPRLAAMWAERLFLTARRFERPFWERQALVGARAGRVAYEDGWLPTWTWQPNPSLGVSATHQPSALTSRLFDSRRTVLLVHGWEGRGSQLANFVAPLLEQGFRVVTFDAPGHGDARSHRASVVDHARAIAVVAKQLGPVHAVVAHSVGGAASLLATRFGLEASLFAFIAPPRSPRGYVSGFSKLLDLEPRVRDAMLARIESRYGVRFADLDVERDAAGLFAPMLVVHDREDPIVPFDDGRTLADAAPYGMVLETHGLGHRAILRDAEVIGSVTRFVAAGAAPTFAETLDGELFLRDTRW